MKLVFNKNSGKIIAQVPSDQDESFIFQKRSQEFLLSLDSLTVDDKLANLAHYHIKDYIVVKYLDEEISELDRYGIILTEAERVNILLQPSSQEIQKAETTIEILSLLQEVNAI